VTIERSVGFSDKSLYTTNRPSTQMKGSAIRPRNATIAPGRPNQRLPRTIDALPMLGPGRNWQRPMVSVKSSWLIQRRSSTIVR
jgi:hypothetical protein